MSSLTTPSTRRCLQLSIVLFAVFCTSFTSAQAAGVHWLENNPVHKHIRIHFGDTVNLSGRTKSTSPSLYWTAKGRTTPHTTLLRPHRRAWRTELRPQTSGTLQVMTRPVLDALTTQPKVAVSVYPTIRVRTTMSGQTVVGWSPRRLHAKLQRRSGKHWITSKTIKPGSYHFNPKRHWRIRVGGGGLSTNSRRLPTARAFRPTLASFYELGGAVACPGYGNPNRPGVAHKTLPCGTMVTIRYRGRQVRVPVIDRGPYSGNREFDLTTPTANALGFSGVGTIWVSIG